MSWQRDYLDREGKHLMTSASPRYDDLHALFINCTLKPSPELSNQRSEWDAGCRFDFDNPDYR